MATSEVNQITGRVIGAAIEVHRTLGPGLLESAYEDCLCHELQLRGLGFERQKFLPVYYKGMTVDSGFRIDVLVHSMVVVEVKATDGISPVHEAQLLTYLRLGGWPLGLLINFNVAVLRRGIRRLVVGTLPEQNP